MIDWERAVHRIEALLADPPDQLIAEMVQATTTRERLNAVGRHVAAILREEGA